MTTEQGSEVEFWELLKIYFIILLKTGLKGEEKMENGSNFIFLTWNYGLLFTVLSQSTDSKSFPMIAECFLSWVKWEFNAEENAPIDTNSWQHLMIWS